MNQIVRRPYIPLSIEEMLPTFSGSNPLAVLAKESPTAAAEIMHRLVGVEEMQLSASRSRRDLLQQASTNHAAQIVAFIQSNAGKGCVDVAVDDEVTEEVGLFGRQRVYLRTTFSGRAR